MNAPAVGERGELPCRVCLRDTVWERIRGVAPGGIYLACTSCSTVIQAPKGAATMPKANWDSDLHMEILPPAVLNVKHLIFLRHLAVHGKLEHEAEGMASGPVVALLNEIERVGRAS